MTTRVMVNGLPGKVATEVARHVMADERLELTSWSLTGPEIDAREVEVDGSVVELLRPDGRDARVTEIRDRIGPVIAVDFTHPTAVNTNADFYCRNEMPFVMGTTGGDRDRLEETVRASGVSAVIAPNMAKQIVGFQAMMAYAADTFPGLFEGYRLQITESHQKGKADTSGTAKAMVGYFNRLGIPFSPEEIVKERDPEVQQREWGVPEAHLGGHGWHTYRLASADGSVLFTFTHNVNGRRIYGAGTVDAIHYLAGRVAAGSTGTVFSMIDVLKGA